MSSLAGIGSSAGDEVWDIDAHSQSDDGELSSAEEDAAVVAREPARASREAASGGGVDVTSAVCESFEAKFGDGSFEAAARHLLATTAAGKASAKASVCRCGHVFAQEAKFCGKCGSFREVVPPAASSFDPGPRGHRASAPALPAQGNQSTGGASMATLLGHLRCDNLKLQEALKEAQKQLETERAERECLVLELEKCKEDMKGSTDEVQAESPDVPCEDKLELEQELIRCKMKCAEAVDRADSLEALKAFYEEQLASLNPNFRPTPPESVDRERVGRSLAAPAEHSPSNREVARKSRKSITHHLGRIFKPQSPQSPGTDIVSSPSSPCAATLPTAGEDMATQREVISCLMAELEKANLRSQKLQAKISKRGIKS